MDKKITYLKNMAAKLRIHSINMTSAAGSGHPTSCLSAAEIMSVLFFDQMHYDPSNLDSLDNDGFVLSKGHAAPILYAAYAEAEALPVTELDELRTFESPLEGHPVPRIPGIKAATGSLGQGLSVGVGMSMALQMDESGRNVYVLLGDGEMAEGNVWEAMNFASYYGLNNLCAVLDMNRLGQSQATMFEWDRETYRKRAEAFGWKVVEVDGHSIEELLGAFDRFDGAAAGVTGSGAADRQRPLLIIAETVKGKHGGSAENKEGYHGKPLPEEDRSAVVEELQKMIEPVDYTPENFITAAPYQSSYRDLSLTTDYRLGDKEATRTAFGHALVKLGAEDPAVVALDGDVKGSTRLKFFFGEYPDRSWECYIAEQNMLGAAVGLAAYGKRVFAASFAAFLTRAHDQIRMASYSRARMVLAGSHTGVSIGADGPSQMGLEDAAMMRSLFGSAVVTPADAVSAEKLTAACANYEGISYIRTIRGKTPVIYGNDEAFIIGGSKVLRSSNHDHAAIVAAGYTVSEALAAAEELENEHTTVRVIDCYSLKPVDEETLRKAAEETRIIITVEDHYPEGGLAEAIAPVVAGYARVFPLAVTKMPHSGPTDELIEEQGIDKEGIKKKVRELLGTL